MKLLATLLMSLMLLIGCGQERKAMSMSVGDKAILHVKHTQGNLDLKISATEPDRVAVKVIDEDGKRIFSAYSSSSGSSEVSKVTEIIVDTQHKRILINGIEHPYFNKGQFVLKDNRLIKM